LLGKGDIVSASLDDLWKIIQQKYKDVNSQRLMIQALKELDEESKILFDEEQGTIVLF